MSTRPGWLKRNNQPLKIPSGDSILTPWNPSQGLKWTQYQEDILSIRPTIHGYKLVRMCKDVVYQQAVRDHVEQAHVRGKYLGLAAAHGPEIFSVLYPHIESSFDSCQIKESDYVLVEPYMRLVEEVYRLSSLDVQFNVYHMDILDFMLKTTNKYSIIDLDLMCQLGYRNIYRIMKGINNCASTRSTIVIWHSSNRETGGGDWLINELYRPCLRKQLSESFKIVKDDKLEYFEGYPMRVDVLSLERICKKESIAA